MLHSICYATRWGFREVVCSSFVDATAHEMPLTAHGMPTDLYTIFTDSLSILLYFGQSAQQ